MVCHVFLDTNAGRRANRSTMGGMTGNTAIDIALLDNDIWSARMLAHWIGQAQAGFHVTWCTHSSADALHRCLFGNAAPDVLIVDMALNDIGGDAVCRRIRRNSADIGLVCITAYPVERYERDAIAAGAQGLLPKERLVRELPDAIAKAAQGLPVNGEFMDAVAAHRLLQGDEAARPALSERERDILRRYMRGDSTTQIAQSLCISPNTVFTHIHRILRKLNVSTRSEAMAVCRAYDLI